MLMSSTKAVTEDGTAFGPLAESGNVTVLVEESKPLQPVTIKEKKFAVILEKLYRSIVHQKGLYASIKMETHAPQIRYYPGSPALKIKNISSKDQLPLFEVGKDTKKVISLERGTSEHRRWLWFTTHEDLQDDSDQVYRAHCRLYADHPSFYNKEVLDIPPEVFGEIIKKKNTSGMSKYKIGEVDRVTRDWMRCAKTLYEEFDGDPVKLLKHAGWGVEAVYNWKHQEIKRRGYDPIPGWGRKLISLYFFYLAELGYFFPNDAFPADLHAQALVIQTGSLNWGNREVIYSAQLAELIRKFVTKLCKEKNWDVLLLGHAQWLKGSFLCNGCANNPHVPSLCVIYNSCNGRVDTGSYTAGKWYRDGRIHTKSGQRAKFGLPTDFPKRQTRVTKRKNYVGLPETIPLFKQL